MNFNLNLSKHKLTANGELENKNIGIRVAVLVARICTWATLKNHLEISTYS